ncbi:MAG: aspartyl protease family protein [Rhodanobacteraceae bacterium]
MSRPLVHPTAFLLAISCCLPAIALAAPGTSPQALLAAMCRAEGNAHLQGIAAIADDASVRSEGLVGTQRDLGDLRDGRKRTESHFPIYASANGIDAHGAWRQDRSGQTHPLNSPEAETLAVTDRWLAQRGYCNLQKLPIVLEALPSKTEHGVRYDRIAATPPRGRSVTLWIDSTHHRLARSVMLRSFQTVTTRYGDYRDVQGVQLPFRISSGVGSPAQADVATVHRYRLLREVPAQAFKRPGNKVTDARIQGNEQQAVVPFTYGNGFLIIEASIDGKAPLPFILDTGGHAILTPAAAKLLGLQAHGAGRGYGAGAGSIAVSYTHVDKLQIGDAEIDDQSFLVIPLSNVTTDLGKHPPIAGILGLEVFERFAVTLDFASRRLTLQPFASTSPPANAHALPIRFTDDMPLVRATLDGQPGIFGVDTGNHGPLLLFPKWAAKHGLSRYYRAGISVVGGGQGGMFTSHMAWIRSLRVAGLDVPADAPGILTPKGVGATSNPSEAGNLGLLVWKHFMVQFNYRHGEMYLVPRAGFSLPQATASAGFAAVKLDHASLTVVKLVPDGPAAKAGLKKGDKIISIDGVPATHLASRGQWLKRVKHGKPGTHLQLVCKDGREIDLVLGSDAAAQKALHPILH